MWDYKSKKEIGDGETMGSERTFVKPPQNFNGAEQKWMQETFGAMIRNPVAMWMVVGQPQVQIKNSFIKTAVNAHHEVSVIVDDGVVAVGAWTMDAVADICEPLDAEKILIQPERWQVKGRQAYFLGENSTMFLQANGDGTFFFVAYSHSEFVEQVKVSVEGMIDVQLRFLTSDGL
jgi:hypothetical protein